MRILRVLQSQFLPCHCFVGVYETYDARTVRIVEVCANGCETPMHEPGTVIDEPPYLLPVEGHATGPDATR
jgi:hypothetical protein